MNRLGCLCLLVLVTGCSAVRHPDQALEPRDKEVPLELIRSVPSRLDLLKTGMTKEEAFRVLGLAGYRPMAVFMGPEARHGFSYYLRTDHILRLTFDETKSPPVLTMTTTPTGLVLADLCGGGWEK
jgi:hypothetical protein